MQNSLFDSSSRKRKTIEIISVGLFFFSLVSIGIYSYFKYLKPTTKEEVEKKPVLVNKLTDSEEEPKEEEKISSWMVDIKGEILLPGTYEVNEEMRITDVIALAGGLTEQADTSLLNLSKKVEDQMVIVIYSKEEVEHIEDTYAKEKELSTLCEKPISNDACITEDEKSSTDQENQSSNSTKVNINKASKEELMTLPGIGEAKANAIITYREEKSFETVEDLLQVEGIGEKLLEDIREQITLF